MPNQPLVSIIIPTFNRAHLIGETLDSVIAQTYPNWECIVVDDGSTDNTAEVMADYVKQDSRIQYHHRPPEHKPGGNGARNYGFIVSKGAYINWFDSDDVMHPEKLKTQIISVFNKDSDCVICRTYIFEKNIQNAKEHILPIKISFNFFSDFLFRRISFFTNPPLWKKKYLVKIEQMFDEDLLAAQEWEFNLRVLNTQPIISSINEPLVFQRKHSDNISNKNKNFRNWHYFLARYRIFNNSELDLTYQDKKILEYYIFEYFKYFVRKKCFKESFKIFYLFIFHMECSLHIKMKLFLAINSFIITGRGEFLLKQNELDFYHNTNF